MLTWSDIKFKSYEQLRKEDGRYSPQGRDEFGVVAVKAGLEAEGTRTDELLRLLEIANHAGVGLALKIGMRSNT